MYEHLIIYLNSYSMHSKHPAFPLFKLGIGSSYQKPSALWYLAPTFCAVSLAEVKFSSWFAPVIKEVHIYKIPDDWYNSSSEHLCCIISKFFLHVLSIKIFYISILPLPNWKNSGSIPRNACVACKNIALRGQTHRRADRQTDGRTTDKVIPMCRYASQATQKFERK